jgi:DtxR family Mn-dependent transcriptional regulator
MRTQAIEDYLKAIYELHEESGAATTSALANRLGVAPASATMMVKKLASLKLVAHKPYRGVVLCKPGERIALEVIRHHRLVESFLAEVLGVPWDEGARRGRALGARAVRGTRGTNRRAARVPDERTRTTLRFRRAVR